MPEAPVVLDSFALLRLFRDEKGADTVAQLLEEAGRLKQRVLMTEVNYAEVQYIVRRKDGDDAWGNVERELSSIPIEFIPVGRELANAAAEIKSRFALSLADAFAAALAKLLDAQLVTGDPEFKSLKKELEILWL